MLPEITAETRDSETIGSAPGWARAGQIRAAFPTQRSPWYQAAGCSTFLTCFRLLRCPEGPLGSWLWHHSRGECQCRGCLAATQVRLARCRVSRGTMPTHADLRTRGQLLPSLAVVQGSRSAGKTWPGCRLWQGGDRPRWQGQIRSSLPCGAGRRGLRRVQLISHPHPRTVAGSSSGHAARAPCSLARPGTMSWS